MGAGVLRSAGLATGLWTCLAGTAVAEPGIVGHWHVASADMVIEVADCDDAVCGRVVGLPDPAALDVLKPDPALAERPLCRLQVLTVMDFGTHWRGDFYNPEDGTDYSVSIHVNDQGKLELWGSTGPILLARIIPLAVAWSPVAPPEQPCEAPPVS